MVHQAMDMPARTTPDSTSTGASSSHPGHSGFPPPPRQSNHGNPIHKFDSLMFPSEDPFAYPNQPMMELNVHKGGSVSSASGSSHMNASLDASQFTMPGAFDEFDPSQFLGQAPHYYMQQPSQPQPQQQQQVQSGLDLSNMYHNSSLLGSQTQQDVQRLEQARRAAQMQRPMDNREMEHMLAEQSYQGSWSNLFTPAGYQGL